jgi:hypothetical protein
VCLGLGELVAVAIEMDELPACDLPGAVRGDGDQGVAAGVIADRSRIGRGVRDGTIHAEIQVRDVPRAEDVRLIYWTIELSANYWFFPGG